LNIQTPSLLDNHIIITPTSSNGPNRNEIKIPRFSKAKLDNNMRSFTKLDTSDVNLD
jgi:hypothetical protein